MEDFKIWVYLAFAAIYLISRAMKKKEPEKKPRSPLQTAEKESPARKSPASFEELLKEFTEEHERKEAAEQEAPVSRQTPEESHQEEIRLEGKKRHFADDESRAIYEKSIRDAEGADISYERDEHFKMKRWEKEEEVNEIASDLRNMLKTPSDAKKAVVLAEILNRRY